MQFKPAHTTLSLTKPPPWCGRKIRPMDFRTISSQGEANEWKDSIPSIGKINGSYPPRVTTKRSCFPGYEGGMEWGGAAADPRNTVNKYKWDPLVLPARFPTKKNRPRQPLLTAKSNTLIIAPPSRHGPKKAILPRAPFPGWPLQPIE